ncbi:hypothetical protein [Edaphobacter sp.]|uniref:DUF4870 domain-containing protein n=1 Tax=Edaphobacter sp. TaxID=1934404 RepID=UPI002DB92301|nr:hypothetical protein [Edaphobacter sp.]HEU5341580.1 hypothetical protein [Edaphobacter sp.]
MEYNSTQGTNPTGAAPAGGLSQNAAAAIAYITIIPAIIFLVMEPYNKIPFVRFHSFQSICLGVAAIIVETILGVIPVIGWIMLPFVALAFLAIWIYTVLQAYKGNWFKLPGIGDFALTQASK